MEKANPLFSTFYLSDRQNPNQRRLVGIRATQEESRRVLLKHAQRRIRRETQSNNPIEPLMYEISSNNQTSQWTVTGENPQSLRLEQGSSQNR